MTCDLFINATDILDVMVIANIFYNGLLKANKFPPVHLTPILSCYLIDFVVCWNDG